MSEDIKKAVVLFLFAKAEVIQQAFANNIKACRNTSGVIMNKACDHETYQIGSKKILTQGFMHF